MDIINPFEELVVFGKKLPLEPQGSTKLRALRPTGRHLGHGLDLTHVRGRASGGPATKLERYTTSPVGLRSGPFGKGLAGLLTEAPKVAKPASGVKSSLGIIDSTPKGVLKPTGAHMKGLQQALNNAPPKSALAKSETGTLSVRKRNSNIPNGARRGGRL